MKKETINLIASELADKKQVVGFNRNSMLNVIDNSEGMTSSYQELVALTSNAVNNDLNLFKNKLLPFCSEYRETVNELVSKYTKNVDTSMYNIKVIDIPNAVNELISRGNISTYGYDATDLPIASLVINTPTPDIIRTYIKAKSPMLTSYLDEVSSGMTDQYLIDLWDQYFTNVSGSNDNIMMLSNDQTMNIEKLLVLYTITTNLITNIPEDVRVSETSYNKIMTNFKDKIAIDLGNMVKKFKTIESQNKLVITINNNIVYVIKSVYDEFLKNNSVDALLGMLFTNNISAKNYYLDDLTINSNKYIAAWEKFIKLENIKIKSNEVNVYRLAYEKALDTLYTDTDTVIKDLFAYDLPEIRNIISSIMKNHDMDTLIDINNMCNLLIANVILTETNLGSFINSMVKYGGMDKTLTSEEVASLATLDLIIEYTLAQIVVSK